MSQVQSALRVTQPQPTFAEAQPACLAEWDLERNDAQDIYPHNTTLGIDKRFTGYARAVQEGSHIAGQQEQRIA